MNFITKCISEKFPINNVKPSYKPPLINTPGYKLTFLNTERAFFKVIIPPPPLLLSSLALWEHLHVTTYILIFYPFRVFNFFLSMKSSTCHEQLVSRRFSKPLTGSPISFPSQNPIPRIKSEILLRQLP